VAKSARERHDALAVCAPGIEAITAAELVALGLPVTGRVRGGVSFRASTRQLYLANVALRTATRVVIRVASFPATSFAELQYGAEAIDWPRFLGSAGGITPRVTSHASRLFHTEAIAERVTGAAKREGDQLVVVRVVDDRVTVSIDTSGEPLYKRGWRHEVGKAPVRETLAAAMLLAAGWNGDEPLVDPFCGSGTIAIEAALLARNIAPGHARRFAFQEWPSFEPGTWASVVATAKAGARDTVGSPIVAGDRDEGAVRAARANAERAGVAADIEVVHAPLSTLTMPDAPAGWIVTNPPYGERVKGGADLRDLYASFGHVVRARPEGWRAGLLVADAALAHHSGLTLTPRFETRNGPIPVSFLTT
jgi:putative N6-adenine-specific DNA methylase